MGYKGYVVNERIKRRGKMILDAEGG